MSQVKRIVVSGASSGIGAATAIAFAAKGARLVLAARGVEGLEDTAARCRAAGGQAHVVTCDVTDADAVARLVQEANGVLGGIDLWFSDVGVGVVGRFVDVPMADHKRVIDANLVGHMTEAHALLPIFLAQGHGIWVNMISVGGFVATPWAAAYAASKFGLRGFSQALRGEMSKIARIHICDVYPTFVDTPGIDHAGNHAGGALGLPVGALTPETVAKAVVRLADHPRDTTVVGAPALAMKLAQFFVPNLGAAAMNGFMDSWFAHAAPAPATDGVLFAAGQGAPGPSGDRIRPDQRRTATLAIGGAAVAGIAAGLFVLARRRDA
ncbi:SDR family oxidoreductase [Sphingomonas sp.]|uniref:SDR family oxidoreductase n=1 Tax=Sphingomonas sp. TaxID=28214 RepID=UPI003AFFD0CE